MIRFKEDKLPKENKDLLKYLYRFQEFLRLFHNKKAIQMKTGEITIKVFRRFQNGWFKRRSILINNKINECKANLSKDEIKELLKIDEDILEKRPDALGAVKDKELYKKDKNIKIDINDIIDD